MIGRLAAAFSADVTGRFARAVACEVEFSFGGLSSASRPAVLDGANRLAVLSAGGTWEVLAFADAEEVALGHWRLTTLLRGLAGSEDAMAAGAVAGAPVVLLNTAVKPLGLSAEEAGRTLIFIAEPVSRPGRVGPFAFAGGLRAETPLSPVHLRAERRGGAIDITWVRRGRIDADDFEATDIPRDEDFERYRLEILDGDAVRRTVEVAAPGYSYASADEVLDFGGAQASLSIRVAQLGRKVPLGILARAEIAL